MGSGPGAVHENVEHPRLERRASLEAMDATEDAEPRLLGDLLRVGAVMHVRRREAHQRRMVPVEQGDERLFVAVPQTLDQVLLVEPGRARPGQHPAVRLRTGGHGALPGAVGAIGSTRTSSRPKLRTRSSRPNSCAWSATSPTRPVSPRPGSRVMPSNAEASRSVKRPRTVIR